MLYVVTDSHYTMYHLSSASCMVYDTDDLSLEVVEVSDVVKAVHSGVRIENVGVYGQDCKASPLLKMVFDKPDMAFMLQYCGGMVNGVRVYCKASLWYGGYGYNIEMVNPNNDVIMHVNEDYKAISINRFARNEQVYVLPVGRNYVKVCLTCDDIFIVQLKNGIECNKGSFMKRFIVGGS